MYFRRFIAFLLWTTCLFCLFSGCKGRDKHAAQAPSSPSTNPISTSPQTTYPVSRIGYEALQYPGQTDSYEYEVYETYVAITKYIGTEKTVSVPEIIDGLPVKVVGGFYYSNGKEVTKVILPDCIKIIGAYAFDDCAILESINIPDGVEEIGRCAFEGCYALTSLTIPRSVAKIGERAFGLDYKNHSHIPLKNLTIRFYKGTAAAKYVTDIAGHGVKYEIID